MRAIAFALLAIWAARMGECSPNADDDTKRGAFAFETAGLVFAFVAIVMAFLER